MYSRVVKILNSRPYFIMLRLLILLFQKRYRDVLLKSFLIFTRWIKVSFFFFSFRLKFLIDQYLFFVYTYKWDKIEMGKKLLLNSFEEKR